MESGSPWDGEKRRTRKSKIRIGSLENQALNLAPRLRWFALTVAILLLCFALPLWKLFSFAAGSDLYSYILLIPFIGVYLFWLRRGSLPVSTQPARTLAAAFLVAGAALFAAHWLWIRHSFPAVPDYLITMTFCFLLFFYGISAWFWGPETLRATAFPLSFLILLVPVPPALVQAMDALLQWGSALAAGTFFWVSGTAFVQDGLVFQLPDIRLQIAPECSGIHSTIVLFITALLSGHIFLRTPWKRIVLVLFVLPLGVLRNGFRVFVIGQLCIHMGPQMINSPIHRKGGPIFFALSLIPLFLTLLVLQKSEKQCPKQIADVQNQPCAN